MLFNSIEFLIFLPVVLVLYYCFSRQAQNVFLVIVSYSFYGWWDWRFCGLLAFLTVLNYVCALNVTAEEPRRRFFLLTAVVGSLGLLGFFKYYNFFLDSFIAVVVQMGLQPNIPLLNIVLPVGISFYTFQTMSYTIDVFRSNIKPTRDFVSLAAYVSFFPQLVAGPIERAGHLLTQFQKDRRVDNDMISTGAFLILLGFFKKLALADTIAPMVESVFASPQTAAWPELWGALWLFAIQIYCDFSGYTDIARGLARLFGFDLMINFNQPYFARNIADYWRRWHISLSTWLRDYIYIPLGGNRKGPARTYINLLITMFLGGLWHGSSWTFVIWGSLHGLYLAVHRWFSGGRQLSVSDPVSGIGAFLMKYLSIAVTINLVVLTWVFFRSQNMDECWTYISGILTLQGSLAGHGFFMAKLAFFTGLILLIDLPQFLANSHTAVLKWPWFLRGLMMAGMILTIILLAPFDETPFIYFQF